jgi:hypothetical protein
MVGLVACIPLHIDERDHLFDQLRPFEELDLAFLGIGFNIATLPVADWRDNEDVLERPVANKFFHSVCGGRVKFSSWGQELQWLMVTRSLCQPLTSHTSTLRCTDRIRLAASPEAGGSDCRSAQRTAPLRRPDGSARNRSCWL